MSHRSKKAFQPIRCIITVSLILSWMASASPQVLAENNASQLSPTQKKTNWVLGGEAPLQNQNNNSNSGEQPAVLIIPKSGGKSYSDAQSMVPISLDIQQARIVYEETRSGLAPPVMPIDLPTVVDLASKNLDTQIALQQVKQAKGRLIQSWSQFAPSFSGENSKEKFNGGEVIVLAKPVSAERTTYRPTFNANLQLDLGRSVFSVISSKHDIKQAKEAQDRESQKALHDSLIAYYTWVRSLYDEELQAKLYQAQSARVKLAEARYQNGFGNYIDIVRAKSLLDEEKTRLLEKDNRRKQNECALINKLNLPYILTLEPKTHQYPLLKLMDEESMPLSDLVSFAEKNRPDIKALQFQIQSLQAQKKGLIASSIIPKLSYNGFIRGIGSNMGNLTKSTRNYGAINFDGLENLGINLIGDMQENKARVQEALLNKEQTLNQMRQDLTQAYLDVNFYDKQIQQTRHKIVDSLSDVNIIKTRHAAGFSIGMDVLESEARLSRARFEHVDALTQYQAAKIRLLFHMGMLTPTLIKNMLG
jgi:outer membrane protein TolC